MRSGVCPKCGSDEVYGSANGLAVGGGTQAAIYPHIEPGFRGFRVPHKTDGLYQYVCAGCGHLELHLLDAEAIDFIRENWVRVVKRT